MKGSLDLHGWKPDENSAIRADVQIANAEIPKLLVLAGHPTLPVSGTLGFRGQIAGTVGDPQFAGDFSLTKGQIDGEPFDSITGQSRYTNAGGSQASVTVNAGAKRLVATASLDHRKVTLHVTSNAVALDQIALVKKYQPDVHGTARVRADATVSFSADWKQFLLEDVGGDVDSTALALGSRNFGDAHLTGATKNGVFSGQFASNAANASIRGDGTVGLSGDYPVTAKVSVNGLKILNVAEVLNPGTRPADPDSQFDGSVEGQATLNGPARFPARMTASIELEKIELHPATTKAQQNMHNFSLANDGPVKLQFADHVLRVESGRFSGPETDLNVSGQVALDQATL